MSSSLSSPDEAWRCPLSDDVHYVGRDARIMETWLFFDDGGGEGEGEKRL